MSPTPLLAALPAWRRFARRAYVLHGLLIAQMLLMPQAPCLAQDSCPPSSCSPTDGSPTDSSSTDSGSTTSTDTSTTTGTNEPPSTTGNTDSGTTDTSTTTETTTEPPPSDPATTDSDGDYLTDTEESTLGSNPYNPDSDLDGLTDADEAGITDTSPTDTDSNNDGVSDFNAFYGNDTVNTYLFGDGYSPRDWDGDGIDDPSDPDPFSSANIPDSDGDCVPDSQDSDPGTPWLWNDWSRNGVNDDVASGLPDSDGDGITDESDSQPYDAWRYNDWDDNGTNDQEQDSDGDGVTDIADSTPHNNSVWCDWNGNDINDDVEAGLMDSDEDGYYDSADTDPWNSALWNDTNRNGINDEDEPTTPAEDRDADGCANDADSHPDNASLHNDWNNNGNEDSTETTPDSIDIAPDEGVIQDSDYDGYAAPLDTHPWDSTLWNDHNDNGINDENELPTDADTDGIPDSSDSYPHDFDNDGLTDADEATRGSDPGLADTDADGLTDGEEVYATTSPTSRDTDNDGFTDFEELRVYFTSPVEWTPISKPRTTPEPAPSGEPHSPDSANSTNGDNSSASLLQHLPSRAQLATTFPSNVRRQLVPRRLSAILAWQQSQRSQAPQQAQASPLPTAPRLAPIESASGPSRSRRTHAHLASTPSRPTPSRANHAHQIAPSEPLRCNEPPPTTAPIAKTTLKGFYTRLRTTVSTVYLQDGDSDGIPDVIEDFYAPLVVTPDGDLDSDGLTNLAEYQAGTDMRGTTTTDFDSDGITDAQEVAWSKKYFGMFNAYRASDATDDFDRDGLTNNEEINRCWGSRADASAVATDPGRAYSEFIRNTDKLAASPGTGVVFYVNDFQLRLCLRYETITDAGFPPPPARAATSSGIAAFWTPNGISVPTTGPANNTGVIPTTSAWVPQGYLSWIDIRILRGTPQPAELQGLTYWPYYVSSERQLYSRAFRTNPAGLLTSFLRSRRSGDLDADTLPTAWEHLHKLDFRNPSDAGPSNGIQDEYEVTPPPLDDPGYAAWAELARIDPDHDGLSNNQEYRARYNPRLPDFGETSFRDTDNDTFTDGEEIIAGFDPYDANSVPPIEITIVSGANQIVDLSTPLEPMIVQVRQLSHFSGIPVRFTAPSGILIRGNEADEWQVGGSITVESNALGIAQAFTRSPASAQAFTINASVSGPPTNPGLRPTVPFPSQGTPGGAGPRPDPPVNGSPPELRLAHRSFMAHSDSTGKDCYSMFNSWDLMPARSLAGALSRESRLSSTPFAPYPTPTSSGASAELFRDTQGDEKNRKQTNYNSQQFTVVNVGGPLRSSTSLTYLLVATTTTSGAGSPVVEDIQAMRITVPAGTGPNPDFSPYYTLPAGSFLSGAISSALPANTVLWKEQRLIAVELYGDFNNDGALTSTDNGLTGIPYYIGATDEQKDKGTEFIFANDSLSNGVWDKDDGGTPGKPIDADDDDAEPINVGIRSLPNQTEVWLEYPASAGLKFYRDKKCTQEMYLSPSQHHIIGGSATWPTDNKVYVRAESVNSTNPQVEGDLKLMIKINQNSPTIEVAKMRLVVVAKIGALKHHVAVMDYIGENNSCYFLREITPNRRNSFYCAFAERLTDLHGFNAKRRDLRQIDDVIRDSDIEYLKPSLVINGSYEGGVTRPGFYDHQIGELYNLSAWDTSVSTKSPDPARLYVKWRLERSGGSGVVNSIVLGPGDVPLDAYEGLGGLFTHVENSKWCALMKVELQNGSLLYAASGETQASNTELHSSYGIGANSALWAQLDGGGSIAFAVAAPDGRLNTLLKGLRHRFYAGYLAGEAISVYAAIRGSKPR